MTVTKVETDRKALTMTVTAHYDAPIERVWQLWADPRLLERWWGPPTYPATVTEHDLSPGGSVKYFMTGPGGDTPGGWWRVIAVDEPHRIEFEDGFADAKGNPDPGLPTTRNRVMIAPDGDRVRMTIEATFGSIEAMEEILTMGAEEGMRQAVGQIDALLTELAGSEAEVGS